MTETAEPRKNHSGLMVRAAAASLIVALVLILIKTWAWYLSGSVALLGSLMDSVMDMLASAMNFMAVRFAVQPADDEHRFGHGKAEAIAGLVQAMIISLSAILVLVEAIKHLITPQTIQQTDLGIAVIVISIILTLGLVSYQKYVVRKTASVAISADSLHYAGDLLLNLGVLAALVIGGYLGWTYADPLFGIGIGFYLLYNVYLIARSSVDMLMDREMEEAEREKIIEIVRAHPEVINLHDMKTRRSGLDSFIQFHIELESDISLRRAHRISHEVEDELQKAFPDAELIIHMDPEEVVAKENIQFEVPV